MTTQQILELVGYFASALVLVSLLMTSVVKLRILNAVGSLIFAVYALLIRSYPTAIMNFCLVIIDLYFLIKVLRRKALFSCQSCPRQENVVCRFLQFYREDIQSNFPLCDPGSVDGDVCFLVYADVSPVGLLIGRTLSPGVVSVELDYSAPSYRDCSVGRFLYAQLPAAGIHELRAQAGEKRHRKYLQSMGFREQGGDYVLTL